MNGSRRALVASLLRGLLGPAALSLGRSMSLCEAPAAGGTGTEPSGFSSSSARLSPPWLRLPEVPGAEPQRANELLLLLPPAPRGPAAPQHHVVYFPGDVQVRRGRGRPAAEGSGPTGRGAPGDGPRVGAAGGGGAAGTRALRPGGSSGGSSGHAGTAGTQRGCCTGTRLASARAAVTAQRGGCDFHFKD